MTERIEAAAKLAWEKDRDFRLSDRWDTLPQSMRDQVMSDIRWYVSAWLEAGKPIWEYEPEGGEYEPAADRVQDFSDTGRPMGEWVMVKSDEVV